MSGSNGPRKDSIGHGEEFVSGRWRNARRSSVQAHNRNIESLGNRGVFRHEPQAVATSAVGTDLQID